MKFTRGLFSSSIEISSEELDHLFGGNIEGKWSLFEMLEVAIRKILKLKIINKDK